MPSERFRLPRRRPRLKVSWDEHEWSLFLPEPDDPVVIATFADASCLALDVVDLPVQREVIVLLDEHRRITALLLDPPAEVGMFVGQAELPGFETPFCQTMVIVIDDEVAQGMPSPDQARAYHAIRRAHMAQGLQLLDVVLTDGDNVCSIAIGCDPDPVWFDDVVAPPIAGD